MASFFRELLRYGKPDDLVGSAKCKAAVIGVDLSSEKEKSCPSCYGERGTVCTGYLA